MRRHNILILALVLGRAVTTHAQNDATALLNSVSQQMQGLSSLTGTMHREEHTLVGKQVWENQFAFVAPDRCRVETTMVSGEGKIPRRISLAVGNDSYLLVPDTKVVNHWSRNLFVQWVGAVGGPANVAAFFTQLNSLPAKYSMQLSQGPSVNGRATRLLELTEKNPEAPMVRDVVRAGGEFPLMVYGVFKHPMYLQPPRVRLYFDGESLTLLRREHFDEQGRLVYHADCKEVRKLNNVNFPAVWELTDENGRLLSRIEYRDLQFNATVRNALFEPNVSEQMIVEEQEPRSISDWKQRVAANPNDPHARYHLAVALLRHVEDAPAALQELNEVIRLRPNAALPWLAAADLYRTSWDLDQSLVAYRKAMELAPEDAAIIGLAAGIMLQQNNFEEAKSLLGTASQKEPRNPHWRVMIGELSQRLGNIDEAAEQYASVISEKGVDRVTVDQLLAVDDLFNLVRWSGHSIPDLETTPAAAKFAGDRLLQDGHGEEALQQYKQAVESEPDNFLLQFSIAGSLRRWGRNADAAKYCKAVVEAFPASFEGIQARRALVGIDGGDEKFDAAWREFQSSMKPLNFERDAETERRLFAETCQKQFKHDQLLKYLNAKTRGTSDRSGGSTDANVFRLLYDLYLWEEDSESATAVLRSACGTYPDNDELKSLLVDQMTLDARKAKPESVERLRRFDNARREAERLVRARPGQPYYLAQLAFIYQFMGRAGFNEALKTAETLVTRFPEDPDSYAVLGTVYLDRVLESSSALANFQKALEMGVSHVDRHEEVFFLRQGMSGVYQQEGSIGKVLQQYHLLLQQAAGTEERTQLYAAMMVILTKNQRMDLALEHLHTLLKSQFPAEDKKFVMNLVFGSVGTKKELDDTLQSTIAAKLQSNPDDPYWVLFDAVMKVALGQKSAGLEGYQKASRLAPADATLAEWLADWYFTVGDYPSAIREYERALRLDPSKGEAHVRLAVSYFKTKEFAKPLELAHTMMLRIPNNVDAFVSLGTLYRECGKLSGAVAAFKEASNLARLDPDTALPKVVSTQFDLVKALMIDGDYAQAESVLKLLTLRQCGIDNRIAAYRMLSEAYVNQKRTGDAKQALNDAIKIAQDEDTKTELQRQISKMGG